MDVGFKFQPSVETQFVALPSYFDYCRHLQGGELSWRRDNRVVIGLMNNQNLVEGEGGLHKIQNHVNNCGDGHKFIADTFMTSLIQWKYPCIYLHHATPKFRDCWSQNQQYFLLAYGVHQQK